MDRIAISVITLVVASCLVIERTGGQTAQDLAADAQMARNFVGTWTLVSAVSEQPDGGKVEIFGSNPIGTIMFGSDGHYALIVLRSDLPKIASKSFLQTS